MKVESSTNYQKNHRFCNYEELLPWDELPEFMTTPEVRPYWEILWKKRLQLRIKRAFDVALSIILIAILLIPMNIIAIAVKLDSAGPVIYRQVRITTYGRKFMINKFRTMYDESGRKDSTGEQIGSAITVANDNRVTRVGRVLRKYRLDEFPQLFNVLIGDMSFVGTRPEVPRYVEKYKALWYATLLMRPGITSECSIRYKDEDKLLEATEYVEEVYVKDILPQKMKINLDTLKKFGLVNDLKIMFSTIAVVAGKD